MWKAYCLKQELLQLAKSNGGSRILHHPRNIDVHPQVLHQHNTTFGSSLSSWLRMTFTLRWLSAFYPWTPAQRLQARHPLVWQGIIWYTTYSVRMRVEAQSGWLLQYTLSFGIPNSSVHPTIDTRDCAYQGSWFDTFTNSANTNLPNLVLNDAPWDKTLQPAHGDRQHRWQVSPQCARLWQKPCVLRCGCNLWKPIQLVLV